MRKRTENWACCVKTVDSHVTHITDANVGARKSRSCRDNIFVLGAVNNSVINGDCKPIQVQTMDIMKCFDKLWLEASLNSLYEAGLKCDILNLLFRENENAGIAVKVNNSLTRRTNVTKVVMQGSVWGGLKCTTSMDKLKKTHVHKRHTYVQIQRRSKYWNWSLGDDRRQFGHIGVWQ